MNKKDILHTHTHTHTHNVILFSHEKEGDPAISDTYTLSEISQMVSLICAIFLS